MQIILDRHTRLTHDAIGNIYVTRPSIMSEVTTHMFKDSPYSIFYIAEWLYGRMTKQNVPMVQDAFPKLSAEDREFLLSGITPRKWMDMFQGNGTEKEKEEDDQR